MKLISEDNPILFEKAEPIEDVLSDEIQTLISDMIKFSMEIGGYGLAAPQVGINKQLFVYRKSAVGDRYKVVINPEIVVASGRMTSREEGCLSHPGFRTNVRRNKLFVVKALDETGTPVRIKGSNATETKILQHEFDHLMGITIRSGG